MEINSERLLQEFLTLVQIDSPTFREGKLALYLKRRLEALSCQVEIDDAGSRTGGDTGNVIGYFSGNHPGAPTLLLTAHMDNVQPCEGVKPEIRGTVIRSSGDTVLGGDDKGGIAVILELLTILKEDKIKYGNIEVLFNIAEEGGLHGVKNLDLTRFKAKLGYCLDSDRFDQITLKSPGAYRIDYTVKGKASHAGVEPEQGISAIIVASKAIARMKLGRIDEETTANIGVIKGGLATNIITPEVQLKAEARSHNEEKLERQVEAMRRAFEEVIGESEITVGDKTFKASIVEERHKDYPAMRISEDSPAFQLAKKAGAKLGIEVQPKVSGGGTDANILNMGAMDIGVIGVGMKKVHTTEEYIDLNDMVKSAEILLQIIQEAGNSE